MLLLRVLLPLLLPLLLLHLHLLQHLQHTSQELRVAPAVVAAASSLQVAASAMVAPLAAFTTSR